jgi:CRP/FNR family cyclic AMP-dependent transcriptional regulator
MPIGQEHSWGPCVRSAWIAGVHRNSYVYCALEFLRAIVRAKMPPTSIARDSSATGGATDRVSLLRNHPLFCELTPPILERISTYMKRRSVSKGATIFEKGDAGIGLIGVVSGSVKISVTSTDGRDIVLNIIRPGEVFGEIALLDGRARTANATAMSDCELIVIERREFIPFLRSEPDVALKLMEILCSRLRKTSEQVQDVTFLNLSTRLAKTLLRLTANHGSSKSTAKVAITQREISQIVGRSRESTNKRLRAWAKRGWIRLERGSVTVLKADKLVELATMSSDLDAS